MRNESSGDAGVSARELSRLSSEEELNMHMRKGHFLRFH